MPWHDISCSFTGEAVQDAVRHFTDRYNVITKPWWRRYWDSVHQYFYGQVSTKNTKAEEIKLDSEISSSFHRKMVPWEKFKTRFRRHWLEESFAPTKPMRIFM